MEEPQSLGKVWDTLYTVFIFDTEIRSLCSVDRGQRKDLHFSSQDGEAFRACPRAHKRTCSVRKAVGMQETSAVLPFLQEMPLKATGSHFQMTPDFSSWFCLPLGSDTKSGTQ